ncbi:MAG: YjjG family noncanonical pyrimidine nucleotidase [Bacteroidota bacterium]
MYKAIVSDVFFDLDHTLWDFERNSALTFKKILYEAQLQVDIDAFLDTYVPINLAYWKLYREEKITKEELRYQRLRTTFDSIGYSVSDNTIYVLAEAYVEHLSSFNHLFPDTIEILEYLKPKYKLHIITNGFQEIQDRKLKNANIHGYFDQVINSEMAGVKKPNPIIFELALKNAGTLPEKSIMIGDSIEADILGARAVGIHTLHFNAHNDDAHEYCSMIHDLCEIKNFL